MSLAPVSLPLTAQLPLTALGPFRDRVIAVREIPARQAQYSPIPETCHASVREALIARGITQLYSHQAEAFAAARAGHNVVLTTGTASGKSLAYLLPIIQRLLEEPSARAFLIFPTKALAQDQQRALLLLIESMSGQRLQAGVYDGDTPPAERQRIRDRANLILTNPDMLNSAILPNHGRPGFAHIFRNVRFVVLDEVHGYRGAFGAHVANLMRRLHRVLKHHGSTPQFLCSSATIANAKQHAETICSRPFQLIERDGSPNAGKVVYFWQPPIAMGDMRRRVASEMALLVPHLLTQRRRLIAFCRSRKETEIVLKESRDRLSNVAGHDEGDLLAGYRGGYKPEERREVERALTDGRLLGVVSTNALELGIDIGQLEIVIQGGFPGTRASFWQQMGRAGRRHEMAHAIVILAMSPIDQYIAENPDWLTGQAAEHAVADRDNLAIQLAHVRAAAAELPLSLDDATLFPDLGEIVAVLDRANEVKDVLGSYHWRGGAFPAGEFSLRNTDNDRFKLVNRLTGITLTEMPRSQAYREAHPRAVYLHDGQQYLAESLDLVGHVVTVVSVEQNYYTQPDVRTAIDVLLTQESKAVCHCRGHFGDVKVDDTVVGYKMLEFHNHQNLGYEALHEPLRTTLETEAFWLTVPEAVLDVLGRGRKDTLAGMVYALLACARLKTMAEVSDLLGTSFHFSDEASGVTTTALIGYDSHPGGLGYAAKTFDHLSEVLVQALDLVQRCRCQHGCPACVGDYDRDKALVAFGLAALVNQPIDQAAFASVSVPWPEMMARWSEICRHLIAQGIPGATLLNELADLSQHGQRLAIGVPSVGLRDWLNQPAVQQRLVAGLKQCCALPEDFSLVAEHNEETADQGLHKIIKLRRRHDDLTQARATNEQQANDRLASGYQLNQNGDP